MPRKPDCNAVASPMISSDEKNQFPRQSKAAAGLAPSFDRLYDRLVVVLGALTLVLFVIVLYMAVSLPVYPDEWEHKFGNSRMFLDGMKLIYLFPACSTGFLVDIPLTWYPARLLDYALYHDMSNLFWLRHAALVIATALLAASLFLARRLFPNKPLYLLAPLIVAPVALGVIPFQLVFNRPEQGLVVVVMLALLLAFGTGAGNLAERSPALRWLLAGAFALLLMQLPATHPKGIYLLPAVLACACFVLTSRSLRLLLVAVAVLSAVETAAVWSARIDCPELPRLNQLLHSLALNPADLSSGIGKFFTRLWQNIHLSRLYVAGYGFREEYQSDWLPAATTPLTLAERTVNVFIVGLILVGDWIIVRSGWLALRKFRDSRVFDGRILVAGLLMAGLAAIAIVQGIKNFYEAGMQVPISGLAVMLCVPAFCRANPDYFRKVGIPLVLGVAVFSMTVLIWRFYEPWRDYWTTLEARWQSARQEVVVLLKTCGIAPERSTRNLVVDFQAYTALWMTQRPIFLSYSIDFYAPGLDFAQMLKKRQVTGIVGACAMVPEPYRSQAVSHAGFCCHRLQG